MPALVKYDSMCRAIDAAYAIASWRKSGHTFIFPRCPGVYVFEGFEDEILYVGESHNLHKRLITHERGFLRRSIGVRLYVLPCINHKQVERWLITELRPRWNYRSINQCKASVRLVDEQGYLIKVRTGKPSKTFDEIWDDLFGIGSAAPNIGRLRSEASKKLAHADRLEAWRRTRAAHVHVSARYEDA